MAHVEKVDGNTLTLKTRPDTGLQTATLDGSTGYRAANVMDRSITLTNAVQVWELYGTWCVKRDE